MTDKEKLDAIIAEIYRLVDVRGYDRRMANDLFTFIDSLPNEPVREDYEIYGSVAAVKALDRKRVCPLLKGKALHEFKNEFNTIKQTVHLLYDYDDPFCYRVALHWASWGAYFHKSFDNVNEEKAKMGISGEPVSEELEEAANAYISNENNYSHSRSDTFKAGAKWQKEQFEKNRLAAYERQTEKEADIERDFVMSIIDNEHRQPTFDDAIKYGMTLQKEQMMKSTTEAT